MKVVDTLDLFRARRAVITFAMLPISILMAILWTMGMINVFFDLIVISLVVLHFIGCVYNFVYIRSLNSDQLANVKNYSRTLRILFLLAIMNVASMFRVFYPVDNSVDTQFLLLPILLSVVACYFGFFLPFSLQKSWLGLNFAQSEYFEGMRISNELRKTLSEIASVQEDGKRYILQENLSGVEMMLRNMVREGYVRNRIEVASSISSSIWVLNIIFVLASIAVLFAIA